MSVRAHQSPGPGAIPVQYGTSLSTPMPCVAQLGVRRFRAMTTGAGVVAMVAPVVAGGAKQRGRGGRCACRWHREWCSTARRLRWRVSWTECRCHGRGRRRRRTSDRQPHEHQTSSRMPRESACSMRVAAAAVSRTAAVAARWSGAAGGARRSRVSGTGAGVAVNGGGGGGGGANDGSTCTSDGEDGTSRRRQRLVGSASRLTTRPVATAPPSRPPPATASTTAATAFPSAAGGGGGSVGRIRFNTASAAITQSGGVVISGNATYGTLKKR